MTHMVNVEIVSRSKRVRFEAFRELLAQEETVQAMAARLKVSERTVHRYLHQLEGRDRRPILVEERMPLILAHLRRYPHSLFTSSELKRVLGLPQGARLKWVLRRMQRDGLIEAVPGLRTDCDYNVPIHITQWRLARPGGS